MMRKILIKSYGIIHSRLPLSLKGYLTRYLYKSGVKPTVNNKIKSSLNKGVVVLSADFEMAWAYRYSKSRSNEAIQIGLQEREQIPLLLNLFEQCNIPVTWATVGHLFLDRCEKNVEGTAHSEMLRPDYFENRNWKFSDGDWYQHDPCSDYKSDPAWYAPDLIRKIINSRVKHEIGCHTFSHIDFTDKNCPPELAKAEIQKCKELANPKSLELKSMVFPGGTFGNFEVLKKNGFICYRKPMSYDLDMPVIDDHRLVAIPSSFGLDRDPYGWSKDFNLAILKNYIYRAAQNKLVCHFWFHPYMDRWYLQNIMPLLLRIISKYRDSDKIQVITMGELAKQILNDE